MYTMAARSLGLLLPLKVLLWLTKLEETCREQQVRKARVLKVTKEQLFKMLLHPCETLLRAWC